VRGCDLDVMRNMHTPTCKGFTLVEVLIALAILSIALAATMRAAAMSVTSAEQSTLRTYANWVAQNRAAELTARRAFPSAGVENGTMEMAGRQWRWEQTAAETPNVAFRKVELKVFDMQAGSAAFATLTVYLSRGAPPSPPLPAVQQAGGTP
jgi:general secretion pathway protein I